MTKKLKRNKNISTIYMNTRISNFNNKGITLVITMVLHYDQLKKHSNINSFLLGTI